MSRDDSSLSLGCFQSWSSSMRLTDTKVFVRARVPVADSYWEIVIWEVLAICQFVPFCEKNGIITGNW